MSLGNKEEEEHGFQPGYGQIPSLDNTDPLIRGKDFLNWPKCRQREILKFNSEDETPSVEIECFVELFWDEFKARRGLEELFLHEMRVDTLRRILGVKETPQWDRVLNMLKRKNKKRSFLTIVGCTDKFVWGKDTLAWVMVCKNNPDHPLHYVHVKRNGYIIQKNMPATRLVTAMLDVVAGYWGQCPKRQPTPFDILGWVDDATLVSTMLADFTTHDRTKIVAMCRKML